MITWRVVETQSRRVGVDASCMGLSGGELSGRITGQVLPGGADYQNLSPPTTIDARYLWETADSEMIIVRNGGGRRRATRPKEWVQRYRFQAEARRVSPVGSTRAIVCDGKSDQVRSAPMLDRRSLLAMLPGLTLAPRWLAQTPSTGPRFRVNGLSQITLSVSDVQRSLAFYQGLFGMPIQARQGSTVLLRIGSGPRFLALKPVESGERPSISALGFGVHDFALDRALQTLAAHGVSEAPATATRPGPRQALVRVRRSEAGGSADGTRELFVADPSGIVFQLHGVSYCGGSGPEGTTCQAAEPSASKGLIALTDTSHFTIRATDPTTVPFYLDLFGFEPLAYQAATPAWHVGTGVHFLMFIGGGGPTRSGGPARGTAAPRGGGAPRGAGAATARGGGAPGARAGGAAAAAAVDHACLSMDGFDPAAVTKLLVEYGLQQQSGQNRSPLVTYISLRMPDRGGAEGGTPELYFTDPDGLVMQLQDVKYCGGGGILGDVCPALPA